MGSPSKTKVPGSGQVPMSACQNPAKPTRFHDDSDLGYSQTRQKV